MKIKNGIIIDVLTQEEHDTKGHAPLGFCKYCKKGIYVPYRVHEMYECLQNPRYLGHVFRKEKE